MKTARDRKWCLENKDKIAEYDRKYRLKNKDKINKRRRRWRLKNEGNIAQQRQGYRLKNKNKIAKRQREYAYNLWKTSPRYVLSKRMSMVIRKSLRQGKNGRSWELLVGYTVEDLKTHLESLFVEGMTWKLLLQGKIHIDHIMPISRFHYEKPEDPEFKICWGLSNLQPLWARDNLVKGSKVL